MGNSDGFVYFLSPGGTFKARFKTELEVNAAALQLKDGNVVVGSRDHYVYFFDLDYIDEWNDGLGTP